MNIEVAIRVRPFNQREKKLKSDLCVKMKGNSTFLLNNEGKTMKTYTFDHCFWSHDNYKKKKNGYLVPKNSSYHDQEYVYNKIGKEMLKNALAGYHCCLFAYGQTGSGKSYSIFGYDANKGIVPMICEELLNGNHLKKSKKKDFVLSVSMLEIYNEKVQDLLIPIKKRPKSGLKVRENTKIGVFVENLSKISVSTYNEIEEVINKGNENKTLASTSMNANSSRAHTIITLELIQKKFALTKTTEKQSIIHLVDLAGSEKVKKTNAKADRLREACSINTSLTVLGRVIHQLYKKSTGKKMVISYRDSALTRILQNSLGGNSRTTMICAISPARDNKDETLSTLRYADQAKQIKLHAKINESETDKLIRELMEENDKLKEMLEGFKLNKGNKGNGEEIEDIMDQMNQLQSEINTKQKKTETTFGSMIQFKKMKSFDKKKVAHILNLNEDPLLSGKIYYDFNKYNKIIIGRHSKEDLNEKEKFIVLKGVGILSEHLVLEFINSELFLVINEKSAESNTFLNGESLKTLLKNKLRVKLNDLDRIIIGTSTTFLVRLPIDEAIDEKRVIEDKEIDWEFCQMEKFNNLEKTEKKKMEELDMKKEKEIKEHEELLKKNFDEEKTTFINRLKNQEKEFERTLKILNDKQKETEQEKVNLELEKVSKLNSDIVNQIELDQKNKELEFKIRLANLKKESTLINKIRAMNENLKTNLIRFYHKIKEANIIANELNRRIIFVPFVASINLLCTANDKNYLSEDMVYVKVENRENGWVNYWSIDKFENRLQLMNEKLDYFFTSNIVDYEDSDPFWDPKEYFLFGRGMCMLKNILYRFQLEQKVGIIGYQGDLGYIMVKLIPINDDGDVIEDEDLEEEIEEPDDLIKNNLSCHYKIELKKLFLYDFKKLEGKNCYFELEVLSGKGIEYFSTPHFEVTDNITTLFFSQFINIKTVDLDIIDYYMEKKLQVRFFVEDIDVVKAEGKMKPPVVNDDKELFMLNIPDYSEDEMEDLPETFGEEKKRREIQRICNIM